MQLAENLLNSIVLKRIIIRYEAGLSHTAGGVLFRRSEYRKKR